MQKMERKPYSRQDITTICLKLVQTHEDRKYSIQILKLKRKALEGKISATKLSDMPKAPLSISNPVEKICEKMELLDEKIADEERRVKAVEEAIEQIGFWEEDLEIREKMKRGILKNIEMGGFVIPFNYVEYPKKYDKFKFYRHRRTFLRDIAQRLNLTLES